MQPTTPDQNPTNEGAPAPVVATPTPASPAPEAAPAAAAPVESASALSDGGASLAAQFTVSAPYRLLQKAYGGVLAFVGVAAFIALIVAYMPQVSVQQPVAQAAAVEVVEEKDPFENLALNARAAYVYDVSADRVIYSKEGTLQLPIASITKVALILAVAEVLKPEDMVTISHEALEKGVGGLTWGEVWRARDLIDYTLITSSNSGALALAEAADAALFAKYPEAPQGGAAVWRMNALARELGLKETYFINATGLDESTTQAGSLGSARDMALLFSHALGTNRELFAGTTRSNEVLAPLNFPERVATNTNNALADIPGVIMGKTGTTDLAGGNLGVAFNVSADHPIVIIVLGSTQEGRFDDIRKLVEATRATVN